MKKNKTKILLFTFFSFFLTVSNFSNNLSQKAKISLITILPGAEIYTLWGHSSIRIKDPVLKIDEVYNYGTFDFNDPGFVLKFLNGTLNYFIDKSRFSRALWNYKNIEKRTVIEQELNLDLSTKNKIFQFLEENMLPQNKYYRYDFTFDNCSTRIRDIFNTLLKKHLNYNDFREKPFTFRTQISNYLMTNKFLDFGFALLLGSSADKIVSFQEGMYLPIYLMKSFDNAVIKMAGKKTPLVLKKKVLYQSDKKQTKNNFFSPALAGWILFFIILFLSLSNNFLKKPLYKKISKITLQIFDFLWFFLIGTAGCLIIFLWFFSNHSISNSNWNLLFLLPTHLLSAFLGFFQRTKRFLKIYYKFSISLILIYLVCRLFMIQYFDPAFIPLILLTVTRLFQLSSRQKK